MTWCSLPVPINQTGPCDSERIPRPLKSVTCVESYSQVCLDTKSCQSQLVNIDSNSTIWVYSLSTVGVTHQLSVNNKGVIPASQNPNGFQVS